jgi:predicted RNA-binding protein with PUA-like domain
MESRENDYNDEPVFYCTNCLSLKIRSVMPIEGSEYCDKCGSTSVSTCNIKEWEELYRQKYGHNYIEESNNREQW